MTNEFQNAVRSHDAFESQTDGYQVTTSAFDSTVITTQQDESFQFTVAISVPHIRVATVEEVGPTVATDWFETFERRLEEAPNATRKTVELDEFDVTETSSSAEIVYRFSRVSPTSGLDIAKTLTEFVEGTYVEGVIPGYEYTGAVADLLGAASQGGESGTPL